MKANRRLEANKNQCTEHTCVYSKFGQCDNGDSSLKSMSPTITANRRLKANKS